MEQFDFGQARDIIVVAYPTIEQWDDFLFTKIGIEREAVIKGDVRNAIVLNTLKQCNGEGLLPQLMWQLKKHRPTNPDVQELFARYAASMVGSTKRKGLDPKVAEAYVEFGLAPSVSNGRDGTAKEETPASVSGLERTLRPNLGYFDVAVWREKLFRLEGRVCRVELNDSQGTMGTGFLVGPRAVLTNYHVLEKVVNKQVPELKPTFRFDYKVLPGGRISDGVSAGLADDGILGFAEYSVGERNMTPDLPPPQPSELDFVLARLDRAIGDEAVEKGGVKRGWVEMPTAQPNLASMPALAILQHPRREPLKLAFDTQPQTQLMHEQHRVRYATNTEGGSSGSPCFDKDWKLVALHHYGDPALNQPKYNQGIPIGLIRSALDAAACAELGGACD